MQRTLSVALASTTVAGLVLIAGPAQAARTATINSIAVKPKLAVETAVNRQTIQFEVRTTGATTVDISAEAVKGAGFLTARLKETPPGSGIFKGSDYLYNWSATGGYNVDVLAYDADFNETKGHSTFQVRRNAYFTPIKATTPVKKGKTLKLTGQLKGLNTLGTYSALRAQKLKVYFLKKGTKKWVAAGTVVTDKQGKFTKTAKATTTGYWRLEYAGNTIWIKATSKAAGIRVR